MNVIKRFLLVLFLSLGVVNSGFCADDYLAFAQNLRISYGDGEYALVVDNTPEAVEDGAASSEYVAAFVVVAALVTMVVCYEVDVADYSQDGSKEMVCLTDMADVSQPGAEYYWQN